MIMKGKERQRSFPFVFERILLSVFTMGDSKSKTESGDDKPFAVPFAERVPTLHLKKGSAKPLYGGHPWVFAEAIARLEGPKAEPGSEVRVVDDQGACMGRGFYSPE